LKQFEQFYPLITTTTDGSKNANAQSTANQLQATQVSLKDESASQGVYEVDRKKLSFSVAHESIDIPHRMGNTPVTITLGIECVDGSETYVFFGNPAIIPDTKECQLDVAAKVFRRDGNFKIIIKPMDGFSSHAEKIRIHWFAVGIPTRNASGSVPSTHTIIVETGINYVAPKTEINLWNYVRSTGNYIFKEADGRWIRNPFRYTTPIKEGTYPLKIEHEDSSATATLNITVSGNREGR
jgi:hypothetical protein